MGRTVIVARGPGPHLADPTWYRVRYALATQCLQIATLSAGRKDRFRQMMPDSRIVPSKWREKEVGWPDGISSSESAWRGSFGRETAGLLLSLYEDRASAGSQLIHPAAATLYEATDLVRSTVEVLERAGWRWVGRQPPRYVRWVKGFSLPWGRWRPGGDLQLATFLSSVVEPASVVLLFSAWSLEAGSAGEEVPLNYPQAFPYDEIKKAIVVEPRSPQLVDRREHDSRGSDWLLDYLGRLVADRSLGTDPRAKVEARLGRTRLRPPRALSFRVRYNLACLFSRLAMVAKRREDELAEDRYLSIAAVQLENALFSLPDNQRVELVGWAEKDPGLDGLRDLRETEFTGIVARWGSRNRKSIEQVLEDSAEIRSVGYDPSAEVMEVTFSDGSVFRYLGVPQEVCDELQSAASPDDYLREQVEGKYTQIRI